MTNVASSPTLLATASTSSSDLTAIETLEVIDRTVDKVKSSISGKKRASPPNLEKAKATKKLKVEKEIHDNEQLGNETKQKERRSYCHHCRQPCDPNAMLRCTNSKVTKNGQSRVCNLAFCDKDLIRRYGTAPGDIRSEKDHEWICPDCMDECQSSQCRKKKGLEPKGNKSRPRESVVSHASAMSPAKSKLSRTNGQQINNSQKQDVGKSDTSSLSDGEEDPVTEIKPKKTGKTKSSAVKDQADQKTASKPSANKSNQKIPKSKSKVASGLKNVPKGEDSVVTPSKVENKGKKAEPLGKITSKSKTKSKLTPKKKGTAPKSKIVKGKDGAKKTAKKSEEKKPRAKQIKEPEMAVDPPTFEKVDTLLSKGEAEQRIALREYLHRFKNVLKLPDRTMPPLDDFDRPLTDASVRVFAGSMVELFREEAEARGSDPDLLDSLIQYREELRYYADLGRFASIYKSLSDSLCFPSLNDETSLIDIGVARRSALRMTSPSDVIRMLLSMAERTLSNWSIRADLDWAQPENQAKQIHMSSLKKVFDTFELKKKKLAEERVQCTTSAQTKANEEALAELGRELTMSVTQTNVNCRAALTKRAIRHGPLGMDLDGRIYYCLSYRPVEDDSRPPVGWGSGLLVWGKGVHGGVTEGDLPPAVERWSHFGKSERVNQLAKWLEWRLKKAIEAARPPPKSPAKNKATPNGKTKAKTQTPKTAPIKKQTTLDKMASSVRTPTKRRYTMEVVIPTSREESQMDDGNDSDLSSLGSDDLSEQVNPVGYQKSVEKLEEEGKQLVKRITEIAEWLEVLEWKGMGEVK